LTLCIDEISVGFLAGKMPRGGDMHPPFNKKEIEAKARAQALYDSKTKLYEVLFIHAIGYGAAVRAYLNRQVDLSGISKVLDAGCGTGLLTRTLWQRAKKEGASVQFHGFDLSPKMLERFVGWMMRENIRDIELSELNVLDLSDRPDHWKGYDLIVTSAMLEYVPRDSLATALFGLREMLAPGGKLLLIITRRTWLTSWFVGNWWDAELYQQTELAELTKNAGFESVHFRPFPGRYRIAGHWLIVVEMM
jgi:cyclopropane fatty-acyl-phospholipid synthase-like methyltransferase